MPDDAQLIVRSDSNRRCDRKALLPDGVERRLRAAGFDVRRDLNRLSVTGADQRATLNAIRDSVAAERARLRRIEVGRRTLEDLFTEVRQ